MADTSEDGLTLETTLASTDYVRAVTDPAGTPESVVITLLNFAIKILTSLVDKITFNAVTAPTTEGDMYFESGQNKHATFSNGMAGWIERCIWSGYAIVTQTGIVTSQSLFTATAIGTRTLPANFWKVGKAVRIKLQGWLTTDAAPGTGTLVVKFGSTTYRSATTFTLDANCTKVFCSLDIEVVCESVGATGTINGAGSFLHAAATAGAMQDEPFSAAAAVTIDTTASMLIDVLWSASDAGTILEITTARIWEIG